MIPAYNSQATVRRALESVARQTVLPDETWVVDDASTDETARVVADAAATLPISIRTIRAPLNAGPAAARNLGIERASGEWIAFLDADDWWHPEKLETQLRVACDGRFDLVGCSFDVDSRSLSKRASGRSRAARPIGLRRLLFGNPFATPTVLVRADARPRFDETMRHGEDFDCWLRLAAEGKRLGHLDLPLVSLGKPPFLASGLSAQLWSMERGELRAITRRGSSRPLAVAVAVVYSLMKFGRRLILKHLRRPPAKGLRR